MGQNFASVFQIKLVEFRPFGGDYEGITAIGHFVHVFDIRYILEDGPGFLHGARIENS